jgi:hypothetical protein
VTTLSPPLQILPKFLETKYNFAKPLFVNYGTTQLHVDKSMYFETTKNDLQTCSKIQSKPPKFTLIQLNPLSNPK